MDDLFTRYEVRLLVIIFTILGLGIGVVIGIAVSYSDLPFRSFFILKQQANSRLNDSPTITNVAISEITENSATIKLKTDRPSTSQVAYCQLKSFSCLSDFDSALKTDHSVQIKGLFPSTYYDVAIFSVDIAQNQAELRLANGLTTLQILKPVSPK